MGLTFRQSLFRLLFLSIFATTLVILINVWSATSNLVEEQLDGRLAVAEGVFERFQQERREQLISSASVLVADFGFKQAVATADIPTISSALVSQRERISADLIALIDIGGVVRTSEPNIIQPMSQFQYSDLLNYALKKDGAETVGVIDDRLFQLILLPVRAPKTVKGVLLIGFELNDAVLSELKEIIRADLIAYQQTGNEQHMVFSSTLDTSNVDRILQSQGDNLSWTEATLGSEIPFISSELTLVNYEGDEIHLMLAVDVSPQYSAFNKLQVTVITVSLVSMILSLVISMLISQRITQPLSSLIDGVKRIAAGDYNQSLDVTGRLQEINHLADAFSTMQSNIASREQHIRYQAEHDNLTQLFNRGYFKQLIDNKLRNGERLQVIGLNIIGFRQINDLYGYQNGDKCIKCVSERLTRWPGIAARLSGSEMYWVPEAHLDEVKLETLKYIIEQPIDLKHFTIPIRASLGVMELPKDASTGDQLFRRMNIVIDEAEFKKKWFVKYSDDLETRYLRRLDIITELKRVLLKDQDELSMAYQPKVCLQSNSVKGVEALIRWNSKALGFVPPDEFIAIAEQAGLIETVTDWVMQQTIADLTKMRRAGFDISIAVNLSTQDVENTTLLSTFIERLEKANLTSGDVELEITESDLVADEAVALQNLDSLREQGFNVSIDDFGTGYSSLAYLKNLPVDIIKIDKSFVLNLSKNKEDQNIVNIVLRLAESFGLQVVAEGVEDQMAMTLLKEWGCHLAQGYFISRPLAYADLIEWLKSSTYGQVKQVNQASQ